jgi:hypothetical protein
LTDLNLPWPLWTLEASDRRFDAQLLHEFIGSPLPEREVARVLGQEKVTRAMRYPELCRVEDPGHPHRIDIVRASGWTASGSDAALGQIENELNKKPENFGKLRGAEEKHLFTWVDGDTDRAVARPFRGSRAAKWSTSDSRAASRSSSRPSIKCGSCPCHADRMGLGNQRRMEPNDADPKGSASGD